MLVKEKKNWAYAPLDRRACLWCDVLACSAKPKNSEREKKREHATLACVSSAGGSEDDDSDEALTSTVVIILTSL
jgi:hypothetical protein